jgi:streptomycin 6-kinase
MTNSMHTVPERLARTFVDLFGDAGRAWLEHLPDLVTECERRWSLSVGPPLENLSYNYIAPAMRADGTEVVLKLGYPHPELTSEIEALSIYDGRGSVRLLDADLDRGALLLERLRPGTLLLHTSVIDDDEATRIAARVMRRLWRPVSAGHPFRTVARWAEGLTKMRAHFGGTTGPLPERLVERAEALFAELLGSMEEPVLLHGDLHHENILRAEREPWLAIDPKGIVGEPAYEVGALLRNMADQLLERPQPWRVVARRVDILAEELGFDRARMLEWGLAQAVLSAWWCIEDHGGGWEWVIGCAELMEQARDLLGHRVTQRGQELHRES